MATVANMSPRHLQRTLKQTTGFAPHDLLKVLRVQQSFKHHYLDSVRRSSAFHPFVSQDHGLHSCEIRKKV
jgi:AraC-like DNA-binding protein